ncbi:MAG: hypothetical protein JOY65_13545 [Acetobacteraceae bacterium]|nr:hypothetical protein [Acetobacteraceae bacterium]
MMNSEIDASGQPQTQQVGQAMIGAGTRGAVTLAAIAAAIVSLVWFAFYMLVFLPRAAP